MTVADSGTLPLIEITVSEGYSQRQQAGANRAVTATIRPQAVGHVSVRFTVSGSLSDSEAFLCLFFNGLRIMACDMH